MSSSEGRRGRYLFGPLEHRGVIAGWRGGQVAVVSIGLVAGVFVLRADPSIGGAVLALVPAALSVAAATWPFAGRTLEEWAPDAVRYASGTARRLRIPTPEPLCGLDIVPVEMCSMGPRTRSPHRAAVVVDPRSGRYVASFRAGSNGFLLLGPDEKASRVEGWGGVLASLQAEALSPHRVQWTFRTLCGATSERRSVGEAHPSTGRSSCSKSYLALEEAAGSWTTHEIIVSVCSRADKSPRRGEVSLREKQGCELAVRQALAVRRRMRDVGISVQNVLTAGETEAFIDQVFRSGRLLTPRELDQEASTASVFEEDVRRRWPWPMAMREEWSRVLIDDRWHCTYWIAEWPRTEVGPDFLAPLLLPGTVDHSVSVVMEPLTAIKASKELERARTADIADSELRRRGGFLATARRRREAELLASREIEIADGHAPYRFSGYVTVSARDSELLDESRAEVEQMAARCGLELRVCFGNQASAFTTCLPLCRGLA